MEQGGRDKLCAGARVWWERGSCTPRVAMRMGRWVRTGLQWWPAAGAAVGVWTCPRAAAAAVRVAVVLGCRPQASASTGLSWVGQLSGWLLPHGFWEESPWALPLEGSLSGAGVGLLLWGSEGNRFSKGCKGPCMGGQPPVISGLGHRWCVASTRAFTPGDASSLLGWLPPGRRQAERAQSKTQVPSRVTGQTRKFPVTDAWLCQVESSVPEVRGPPKGLLPAPGSLST